MSARVPGRVSIVVLTWNNRDVIGTCLESIRGLEWPNREIIVVDNGSHDGCREYLEAQPDVRLLALPRNTGFAGGQVAAWPLVTGEFVALVNSDAVVAPDWLRALLPEFDDARVAAAAGRAYEWRSEADLDRVDVPYYAYQVVDRTTGWTTTVRDADEPTDVDSIAAAAVVLRASAVDAVGGFDRRFFAYYEETDLFARMIRHGLRIRYQPGARAWHQIRGSSSGSDSFYLFFMRRNVALFFLRNFDGPDCRRASASYARELARVVRGRGPEARVAVRSALALIGLLPHALSSRRKVMKLGPTYGELLSHRPTASP